MQQEFEGIVQGVSPNKRRGFETGSYDLRISRKDNQAYVLANNVEVPIQLGDPVTFELDPKTGKATKVRRR